MTIGLHELVEFIEIDGFGFLNWAKLNKLLYFCKCKNIFNFFSHTKKSLQTNNFDLNLPLLYNHYLPFFKPTFSYDLHPFYFWPHVKKQEN